jgi:hypothetical protein
VLLVVLGGIAVSACGSSSPPTTTTTTTSQAPAGAQNLTVTPTVRTQLLAAAAATHGLPVSDYVGLAKGLTYYAFDSADGLYWAGSALVPSPASFEAQVGVQDDGGYNLFTRSANGQWVSYDDGLGTVPGSTCELVVPAVVREVWGWSLTTPCGGPPGG